MRRVITWGVSVRLADGCRRIVTCALTQRSTIVGSVRRAAAVFRFPAALENTDLCVLAHCDLRAARLRRRWWRTRLALDCVSPRSAFRANNGDFNRRASRWLVEAYFSAPRDRASINNRVAAKLHRKSVGDTVGLVLKNKSLRLAGELVRVCRCSRATSLSKHVGASSLAAAARRRAE
jgi:hypothetical protein